MLYDWRFVKVYPLYTAIHTVLQKTYLFLFFFCLLIKIWKRILVCLKTHITFYKTDISNNLFWSYSVGNKIIEYKNHVRKKHILRNKVEQGAWLSLDTRTVISWYISINLLNWIPIYIQTMMYNKNNNENEP